MCMWAVFEVLVQHWRNMLGHGAYEKLSYLAREGSPVYWKIRAFCKMGGFVRSNKLKAWDAELAGRLLHFCSVFILVYVEAWSGTWDMRSMMYNSDEGQKAVDKGVGDSQCCMMLLLISVPSVIWSCCLQDLMQHPRRPFTFCEWERL